MPSTALMPLVRMLSDPAVTFFRAAMQETSLPHALRQQSILIAEVFMRCIRCARFTAVLLIVVLALVVLPRPAQAQTAVWTQRVVSAPQGRNWHAMVFDSIR